MPDATLAVSQWSPWMWLGAIALSPLLLVAVTVFVALDGPGRVPVAQP